MAPTAPSATSGNKTPNVEDHQLMSELRKYLMLMAILAATVTYVAGLNPPGGVWLETEDGHLAGNQILVVTHHARYNFFYYSNGIAFMASVVVILLLLRKGSIEKEWWLFSLRMVLVLDLLSLMVAYAAGASRGRLATVYVSVLVSAVSIYAARHIIRYLRLRHRAARGKVVLAAKDVDKMTMRPSKILMVFAVFSATVTYTAGLNPPGGFWPDSQDGHRAGDPVLQDLHHWLRFMAFFVCNSTAFAASLVSVMLLTTMSSDPEAKEESFDKGWSHFPKAYWFVLLALLGILVAYGFGSSRKTGSTINVLCLLLPLLVGCILLQFVFQKFWWEAVFVEGWIGKTIKNWWKVHTGAPYDEILKEAHDLVLLLATLAATITYQAGMNPPGGVWPDDRDGHKGGDPILLTTHARRYKVFFYCNSVALVASLVVIAMLLSKHLRNSAVHKYNALEAAMILDLLSLVAAYAVGCCRDVGTSIRVIALAAGVLVYILIHMVLLTLHQKQASPDDEKMMKKQRKVLLLIAILAATITYQAGLAPPGAFWLQEGDGHDAGYTVLATNYPQRYTAFFYCNATSFMSSIATIILLANPRLYKLGLECKVLYVCAVAGLFGLAGAYTVGSSRHTRTSVVLVVVLIVVAVFVLLLLLLAALIWRLNKTPTKDMTAPTKDVEQDIEGPAAKQDDKTDPTKDMFTTGKYMMLVSILVAGVTYQAGLTPPGGMWPDSTDGHAAGDPVLRDSNKRRYRLFFYSNSISFLMSLLVILLLLLDKPLFNGGLFGMKCQHLLRVAQPSLLLALLSLMFAYAAGCSREWETSGYVLALVGAVLLYFAIHMLLSYWDKISTTRAAAATDHGASEDA